MNLRDYLYDNWKEILAANLPRDHEQMRIWRRCLLRGNLHWMVRRLIGGIPSDGEENIKKWIAAGEMLAPDEFTRRRRVDESRKHKNQ